MNSVILLTRLQITQTLGGVRSAVEKRTGANGALTGTLLIGLMLFAGTAWLGYTICSAVGSHDLGKTIYDVLFLVCGLLTFTFSLPSVLGSFFGSSDIDDLLPLPVSPFAIVLSKAFGALSTSYLWTFLFICGPLLGWGIASGAGVHYWIMYFFAVVFTPFMPTAYAGTLSILIATVFKRVRRKDAITTIATVLTLGLSVGFFFVSRFFSGDNNLTQLIGGFSETMGNVVMVFPAYGFAVYALSNPDPLGTAMFVLLSVSAFVLFVVIARVLYMRIVTSLSSGAGKVDAYTGADSNEQSPVLKSLVRTEIRKVVRNSSVLLYYVIYPLVITPALFGIVFFTGSTAETLSKLGSIENASTVLAGFALVGLMACASLATCGNKIAATAVSREGSNWIHIKYFPVPIETQVFAKTLTGYFVSALITLVIMIGGGYLLVTKLSVNPFVVACAVVLMLGGSWLMNCVGAWTESRNPNVEWGNDGDVNVKVLKGGGAELRALLVGLVYSALPLLVSPLVNLDQHVFMPVLAVVGVAAAIVLGRLLLGATVRNIQEFE